MHSCYTQLKCDGQTNLHRQAASCEGEDFKRVKVEKFEVGKVRSWKRSKLKKIDVTKVRSWKCSKNKMALIGFLTFSLFYKMKSLW